jgi:OOP family OmpA-OmpF porin
MKKILLIGLLLLTGTIVAQEADYNKWSIELQGGASKATRPFTPGYVADEATFFQGSVGVHDICSTINLV